MEAYDTIAEEYRDSKLLSFREHVERYTLFEMLGDVRGKKALDMACGDGFYSRLLKRAGVSAVTGVDISAAMIDLAEGEERRSPLGCEYVQADAAAFEPAEPVDLVVANYLLNYAGTREQLLRFCRVCHDALRPAGRFVGVNDNVRKPPAPTDSWKKYGLEKSCTHPPAEGDVIRYAITNPDGRRFEFDNFYLRPETYAEAFREAGFQRFRWVDVSLHPAQRGDSFWDDFMTHPPIVAFEASR